MNSEAEYPRCVSFETLFHQGTLDPSDKGCRGESYEGHGLSVSTDPEAWEEIARLGGLPLWELSKKGNRFLDFHSLNENQRAQIADWAVREGYSEKAEAWEWRRYDDELEDDIVSLASSLTDALWEAGFEDLAETIKGPEGLATLPDEAKGRVRKVETLVPTAKLCKRLSVTRPGEPTVMIDDWMAIAFAEEVIGTDGVWWSDNLDPAALSAPRGVIFPDKLAGWQIRAAEEMPSP